MVSDERLTPEREDEIQGAAETLQWARDKDAADMMLDLLAEIRRLRAEPGRGLLLRVAEAVRDASAELCEAVRCRAWSPKECAWQIRDSGQVNLSAIVDAIAPETEIERAERAVIEAALRWNGGITESRATLALLRAVNDLREAREAAGR